MKKYLNKVKNHLLCSYVIFNILFLLVTLFLYSFHIVSYKLISLFYIALLVINILAILTHIFIKKKRKEKLRFKSFDIFLLIFFILTLISSILSINTHDAFFGRDTRFEGFFQISYYFSLFLLSSFLNKKEKKYVTYFILTLGLFSTIHAHIQKFELFNIRSLYNSLKPDVSGYTANPNFLGSEVSICLGLVIGLLFDSNNKKEKIIYYILLTVFTSGLLISDTLSALVALICILIYTLVYAIRKNKKLIYGIIILIISLMTLFESITKTTSLVKDLITAKDQSIEIVKGNIKDNYGTNRMFIWKETIKVVPNNLTYGVGVDNFYYAFGKRPLVRKYRYIDKAHNEYLQILVCEGIYALISYLVFIGILVVKGIKYSNKNNTLFLLLPVLSYLVQAFFNISVIEVAPLFYICLGLLSEREKNI